MNVHNRMQSNKSEKFHNSHKKENQYESEASLNLLELQCREIDDVCECVKQLWIFVMS